MSIDKIPHSIKNFDDYPTEDEFMSKFMGNYFSEMWEKIPVEKRIEYMQDVKVDTKKSWKELTKKEKKLIVDRMIKICKKSFHF